MSIQAMHRVMEDSEAKAIDRLVLLVMANRAGGDFDECFASVPRLAYESRVTDRTVQRAIMALCESGDLVFNGVHDEYRTNIYRVMPVGVSESHPGDRGVSQVSPKQKQTTTEPRTRTKSAAAAAATRPTDDQAYLVASIAGGWDAVGAKKGRITIPALQKLNSRYGVEAVTSALREVRGFPPAEALRSAYAYVEAICKERAA